jgi:hypothetical protein
VIPWNPTEDAICRNYKKIVFEKSANQGLLSMFLLCIPESCAKINRKIGA